MRYLATIFDLDDTLYLEKHFVLSGFRAVAKFAVGQWDMSTDATFDELQQLFESGNRTRTFDAWLASHKLPAKLVPQLVEVYRDHAPRIQLFDGMRELLSSLSVGIRIGLISDGFLAVQRRKFAALNIEGFFSNVIYSDAWGQESWKPADRPYREALESLDILDASQAVYIGDNPIKDFVTPRAMGMYTIQLRLAEGQVYANQMAPSPAHEPHTVVTSVGELESSLI